MRQNHKRRSLNRHHLSALKTQVKKLRAAVAEGDAEGASRLLPATLGQLDRAKQKGVIHANAASRSKSRLARSVSGLTAAKS
jgi:small subunit ribosomal protein S20